MELDEFIENWEDDSGVKDFFSAVYKHLQGKENCDLSFKARPGITYSLRSQYKGQARDLYILVDLIDDDPAARWLSICFYADSLTDELLEEGDVVPGGLAGKDACCFDVEKNDESAKELIFKCLDTAYDFASKN